ncbi:MAG TPA: PepSY domain-containing protein [Ramlibacter sp.]|uniref:PepSY domain-containing protein n=1 Tax=Ramlibacter sp. TaxID=1917967 RepID=UPI002D7E3B56|nr:PepSY domain-containing protein [Ramlibacter sp.]HET8748285.1 PepSY domain-containing protein [Ramlibacter sp.]
MSLNPFPFLRPPALALFALASATAWADDDCDVPPAAWQPRSAVHALAQREGWQVRSLKVDDGCYEIKGRDTEGVRFKAKLDPATLQVIRLKRAHGERDRQRARNAENLSPSPSHPLQEQEQ